MYPDYHMHTHLSDGRDTHQNMLLSAKAKGIEEIGFSDHISTLPVSWAMQPESAQSMANIVKNLSYIDSSVIVKCGAEIDYYPSEEKRIADLISSVPFDYVIGSVHFISAWNFDTDFSPYDSIDIDSFYKNYFGLVQKSAKSGLFDIIGHCDLAKKFGYKPSIKLDRIYEETAKIFADYGAVYELNTSGKDKPCAEFYPSKQFVEILCAYKVPVTLCSDSHIDQNIGKYFDEAAALLKDVGYRTITTFTQRNQGTMIIE